MLKSKWIFLLLLLSCNTSLWSQVKSSVDSADKAIGKKLFSDTAKKVGSTNILDTLKQGSTEISNSKVKSALQLEIEKIKLNYNIPELAYGAIFNDSIKMEEVIGFKRKSNNDTSASIKIVANTSDLFHIGANTKSFTSYLIFKLIKSNQLKLENKLTDILPELAPIMRKEFSNITIAQLLSHRAGLQVFASGEEFKRIPKLSGTLTERRLGFCKWVLKFQRITNKSFVYSNAGYVVLASVIEKLTNQKFEDYAKAIFLSDFGIRINFGWPNLYDNQPWGHWIQNDSLTALGPDHPFQLDSIFTASGDLHLSLKDYLNFIREQVKGLNGQSALLSQKDFETMHYGMPEYAMGWGNFTNSSTHISALDGSAGTFYAHCIIIKEKKISVVVLTNTGDQNAVEGIYKIRDLIIKSYLK
jgi:D-alanyl-D-alanine carboxypeptidase